MKPNRDAAALAASLTSAAAAPLQSPPKPQELAPILVEAQKPVSVPKEAPRQPKQQAKVKVMADTVGITLRPSRELLNDYTVEAGDRTKREGRVISAQEIMLEVLHRGRPKVKS
ncbi:MAG: hypothetical protein WCD20_04845 [Rhodomicrobium sp.]